MMTDTHAVGHALAACVPSSVRLAPAPTTQQKLRPHGRSSTTNNKTTTTTNTPGEGRGPASLAPPASLCSHTSQCPAACRRRVRGPPPPPSVLRRSARSQWRRPPRTYGHTDTDTRRTANRRRCPRLSRTGRQIANGRAASRVVPARGTRIHARTHARSVTRRTLRPPPSVLLRSRFRRRQHRTNAARLLVVGIYIIHRCTTRTCVRTSTYSPASFMPAARAVVMESANEQRVSIGRGGAALETWLSASCLRRARARTTTDFQAVRAR